MNTRERVNRTRLKRAVKEIVPARAWSSAKVVRTRARAPFYRGRLVTCPCCGHSFRKFAPSRTGPNRTCPYCLSGRRHRLIALYLRAKTNIFTERLRVLHVAPERCLKQLLEPRPNLDYVGADLSSPLAAVKMDVTDIPFEDESFDVVLCVHVLEHVSNDMRALSEILRILRRGGWAIIQTPVDKAREHTFEDTRATSPTDRERLFGQDDHVRVYGRDFPARLERAGFHVKVEEEFARELPRDAVERYGVAEHEAIHLCRKTA
jgi:SAM-dependent methyltransferase